MDPELYRYRHTALLMLLSHFLNFLQVVPAFTGRYTFAPGVTIEDVLLLIVGAMMAWQAVTMQALEVGARSEDEGEDKE